MTPDPLCLAMTRPATKWGVPYSLLLAEMVLIPSLTILSDGLSNGLFAFPVHAALVLLYRFNPRAAEVARAWCLTCAVLPRSWGRGVWSVGPASVRRFLDGSAL